MDELSFEEFQSLFGVLLEVFGKRDESGAMARLYWMALSAMGEIKSSEFLAVMTKLMDSPPAKLPSGEDIKGLIRQYRIDRLPKLPSNPGEKSVTVTEFRQNRIAFLRGIYKHQGDTQFYRSMLAGNAGVFSRIADQVLGGSGLTAKDLAVTHQDVVGAPRSAEEVEPDRLPATAATTAKAFQPDRRFMSNLAKQMLGEG